MYRVYYISDQMFAVVEGRVPISYAITIIPVTLVKIKSGVALPKLVLHEFYIWGIEHRVAWTMFILLEKVWSFVAYESMCVFRLNC
jgi:hypothetical protein